MSNKQKLFEVAGSLLMILVLAGLIAAAILPWYTTGNGTCTYAWFSVQCNSQSSADNRGTHQMQIYNAAYSLTVISCVVCGFCVLVFGLYVWGSIEQRCVPVHGVLIFIILAAVVTFAVGLPLAIKADTNASSSPPFMNGSTGAPGIGWWIAMIASIVQAIVFILFFCAFR